MLVSFGVMAPGYFASVMMTLMSVCMGLLSGSVFMLWLMMEFGVCSFCGVLAFTEFVGGEGIAKYFIVNAVSGTGILSGMMSDWSWCVEGMDTYLVDLSLFVCIYSKLGLPPFHFWVVGTLSDCVWFSAFLLLGVQKILPLVLFGFSFDYSLNLVLVALASAILAGLAGLGHTKPYSLIGYSSMVVSNWLILISFISVGTFLVSLVLYVLALLSVLGCLREGSWSKTYSFQAPNNSEVLGILLLVFPTGPIYLVKVLVWTGLSSCGCMFGAWGVAFTSVLLVPLYMRVITMASLKVWGQSVNSSYLGKWLLIPLSLSLMVFSVSGFIWSVDFWSWV